MNKKEYLNFLQTRIDELSEYLEKIPNEDKIEKALTLGKINSFLVAKLYGLEIQENAQ